MTPAIQARRDFLVLAIPAAAAFLQACKGTSKESRAMSYPMGERASVGKLIYNVSQAAWKTELGEGASPRIPEHRFLVVTLSITNSGPQPTPVPLLHVYDAGGKQHRELDSGEHLQDWLGLLRIVGPTETRSGAILFDVPPTSYKLQITDGQDAETEMVAYVDLPFQMDSDPVLTAPPALDPARK